MNRLTYATLLARYNIPGDHSFWQTCMANIEPIFTCLCPDVMREATAQLERTIKVGVFY